MSRVAVVGAGYVGLTTAACLSALGHHVACVDIDATRVALLNAGRVPIHEPGIDTLLGAGRSAGTLTFSTSMADTASAEVVLLCVPTPQRPDGSCDLSSLCAAVEAVGPWLQPGCVLVIKSTAPVGTTSTVASLLQRSDVAVASNPEFLREGSAVDDFMHPDRVVIGADDPATAAQVAALYAPLRCQVIAMSARSAELTKYAANAYLALRLSYVNTIADLAADVGASWDEVRHGIETDERIGTAFLNASPGWGGSCFPKDTSALCALAADHGADASLVRAAIDANSRHADRVAGMIIDAARRSDRDAGVACVWGLTFKAGTDDLRDSPAVGIVGRLLDAGVAVQAYDPTVLLLRPGVPAGIRLCSTAVDASTGADVLALLTEWPAFTTVALDRVGEAMRQRQIVDGRNLLDPALCRQAGFSYRGVGR